MDNISETSTEPSKLTPNEEASRIIIQYNGESTVRVAYDPEEIKQKAFRIRLNSSM